MKLILTLMLMLSAAATQAYECEYFMDNEGKVEALTFIVTEDLGYDSLNEFCERHEYMDLELGFMPNYFKYGEEDDDHYKLMIHKSYSSCTFIYNSTKKFVTDRRCYSTW